MPCHPVLKVAPPLVCGLLSQGIASLLMVPPDGLLSLVDSGLRMSHSQALRYIRLRTDFKTARVGGKSLDVLFAYD